MRFLGRDLRPAGLDEIDVNFGIIQDALKDWKSEGIPTPHTVCIPWLNYLLFRLIKERARAIETQWKLRHRDCEKSDGGTWFCKGPMVDARHDLTPADWEREAERELREEP